MDHTNNDNQVQELLQHLTPRQVAILRRTADSISVARQQPTTLEDILVRWLSQEGFCRRCRAWLPSNAFYKPQLRRTPSTIHGTSQSIRIIAVCRGCQTSTLGQQLGRQYSSWVVAAKRLGLTTQQYITRRQQGFRYCCICRIWTKPRPSAVAKSPGNYRLRCPRCRRLLRPPVVYKQPKLQSNP